MEQFPIQDLHIFEKDYAELKESYASLEGIFNEAINEMDFSRYYEDQARYEEYLLKLNSIEKEMKRFEEKLNNLKLQLSN